MKERKDLLRRNEVKKGKILAGLLAALLILSILPAGAFADTVLNGLVGTVPVDVIYSNPQNYLVPIVFNYDKEFVDWFGSLVQHSSNDVHTKLNPIIKGNRLQLVFGGEEPSVTDFGAPQANAIRQWFKNGTIEGVDVYLTNLTPRDPRAMIYSYPKKAPWGIQESSDWPSAKTNWAKGDTTKKYIFFTDWTPATELPYREWPASYDRISNLIGMIGESTRVNVFLSNELSEVNIPASKAQKIYRTVQIDDTSTVYPTETSSTLNYGKGVINEYPEYFVSGQNETDAILSPDGQYKVLWNDNGTWKVLTVETLQLQSWLLTSSTYGNWMAIDWSSPYIQLATEKKEWRDYLGMSELDDGDWTIRDQTRYNVSNYYFNDLTNVGINAGANTYLDLSGSSHINDVVISKGGYLNLSKVNYSILNSVFTKWIDNLVLEAGSTIDFPVGTTDEIAATWLNGVSVEGVVTRVNGKTVTLKPGSKPPAPAEKLAIGASHASPTSVSLNWNAAAGATGYNLYQANSSTGNYQLIATNTPNLSAAATGLATGSYYWFKAAAVDAKGEIAVSDPIQVRARPLRPASINAAAGSKTGSAKVSWGSVAECDGYAVYVSTSRTGAYTLKSVVSGRNSLSAQVAGLKSGATYYFKVASYVQVGPAKVPSVYTGVVSAKAK
jgi:hypothetical protein